MLWPLLCTGVLDQEVQWTGQDAKRIWPGSTHFLWMQSGSQHCKGAGPWVSTQVGHLVLPMTLIALSCRVALALAQCTRVRTLWSARCRTALYGSVVALA